MLFRRSAATTRAHQEEAVRRRKSGRNRLRADRHRRRTGQAGREDFTSLVCQVVRRKSAEIADLCAGQGRQPCPVDVMPCVISYWVLYYLAHLFEVVKLNISARQAAEAYGFRPNRSSMVCCPFHADRNPSMKVDSRFHCFGCGVDGDVIDFTAKLFQLSLRQAAEKLASDFGLSGTDDFSRIRYKLVEKSSNPKEQLYKILCNYRSLLADWRITYAPQNPEDPLHPCFIASIHYADRVQYLLDILLQGSSHEKQQLLNGKEVTALGEAIERCKEAEEAA